MVIAAQSAKRPTSAHKKRQGQHQKQTKHYMKTYWPYLPLLVVASFVNILMQNHFGGNSAETTASLAEPTRLQLWTHASYDVTIAVCFTAFVAIMYVFARHAKAWHRVVVKGEAFVIEHHMIDVGVMAFALCGIILTRTV